MMRAQKRVILGFRGRGKATNMIKTHQNNVRRFAGVLLPLHSTVFHADANFSGNAMEKSWKTEP
jgi:imidazoleglycerol phosphate dehydratase HisB